MKLNKDSFFPLCPELLFTKFFVLSNTYCAPTLCTAHEAGWRMCRWISQTLPRTSHAFTQSIILCCWEIPKWIIHLWNKWLMSKHLLMQTKLTEINGWITHCLKIYKSNIYYDQINQNYKGFSAAFQNACQKLSDDSWEDNKFNKWLRVTSKNETEEQGWGRREWAAGWPLFIFNLLDCLNF